MVSKSAKIISIFESTLFFAFLAIIVDCVFTGYGHWLMLGPFSIRILLWGYCVAGCIPLIVIKWKQAVFPNSVIFAVLCFGLYFISQAVRGYLRGNDSQILVNDVRAYSWIALAPVACVVFGKKSRIEILLRAMTISSLSFAVLILATFLSANIARDGDTALIGFIMNSQLCSISRISKSIIRFSYGNSIYIVPTIIYLFFQYITSLKILFPSALLVGFGLIVLLFTYTRSYYLGAMLALLITIAFAYRVFSVKTKNISIYISLVAVCSIIIILIFNLSFKEDYFLFSIKRIFPGFEISKIVATPVQSKDIENYIELTKSSDTVRKQTMDELSKLIKNNYLFGNGLGSGVAFRECGRVEYFYQDLLQKLGIFGMALFLYPIILMVKSSIWYFKKKVFSLDLVIYLGLVAFLVASYFNPIMNSSIGLCYYSVCIAVLYNSQKEKRKAL